MLFSLGSVELLILCVLAVVVGILHLRRHRHMRIAVVSLACVAVAAITTPADIVSTVLMSLVFAGIFTFGAWFRIDPPTRAPSGDVSTSSVTKAALMIIAAGILMLIVGAYYAATNTGNQSAHHAFRSWAFSVAGIATTALGCLMGLVERVRRKAESSANTLQ